MGYKTGALWDLWDGSMARFPGVGEATLKDIGKWIPGVHGGLWYNQREIQYIPRNMHTAFALLCFVVVIHWLIFPYPSGLLHWHCGNLTIAPVPAKQPWWIWINTSCEFIMNDCITTTKQSTTKPCAYFLGYTVNHTRIISILFDILTENLAVLMPTRKFVYIRVAMPTTQEIYNIGRIGGRLRFLAQSAAIYAFRLKNIIY